MSQRNTHDAHDEARRLLGIYLQDHHAAGLGGLTVARRRLKAAAGTPLGETLTQIVEEIEEEREILRLVLERYGKTPSRWKAGAAQVAVELSRLKMNGRLFRRSPLTSVLELEGLIAGIEGKRRLWEAMGASFGTEAKAAHDWTYRGLSIRAESQRERLMPHHRDAARAAFADVATGSDALSAGSITGAGGGVAQR